MPRIVLMVVLASFFPSPAPETAAEQLSRLRGEWRLACTRDEKRVEAGSGRIRMTIHPDGSALITSSLLPPTEGMLRTPSCVRGHRVDLHLADGRTLEGVFEQKGDYLVICFAEAGKPRPADVTPRGTQWAEVWQRSRR